MTDENGPLVLYVEDDLAVLELGVAALEEGSFRVQPVQSAGDATLALEKPDLTV